MPQAMLARCCCAHPADVAGNESVQMSLAMKACQALTALLFARTLMWFVISVTRLNLEWQSACSQFWGAPLHGWRTCCL
jgi:hypothetical protein